jgi:iron complex outermembrane receptor protein
MSDIERDLRDSVSQLFSTDGRDPSSTEAFMRSICHQFSFVRQLITITMSLTLAISAWVPAALGQSMEEVVVTTARGREESVKDVPASVTVITESEIESLGIERVEDFIALTPGVSIVNSAEVADTQVNIRGINGSRDAENSYALIIDGVLMTNPAALNREYQNLSQIEILKGPQGALYGRNAAAGAIIITTKEPGEEFAGEVKGSVAQDDTYTIFGRLDGPVTDGLNWQLTGGYRDTDGYYSDVFNNSDDITDNFEDWNVAGRLIWEPSDATRIDTKIRYGEVDAASISFNSSFQIPEFVTAIENFGLPPDFAAAGDEDVNDHPMQFNPNIVSFNEQEAFELSIRAEQDIGFADLIGWLLYSDVDNKLGADGTSGAFGFFWGDQQCIDTTNANGFFPLNPPQLLVPQDAFGAGTGGPPGSLYGAYTPTSCDGTQYQERNQDDLSFELRLRSKDDQRLRWEGGLYYLNIDREVGVNLGIDTGAGVVKSLFTTDPANPTEQLVHDKFDSDVYAAFGQLAYDLTDSLELAFALRYDYEDREVTNQVPTNAVTQYITCDVVEIPILGFGDFTGGAPINPGLCPDVNPSGTIPSKSDHFDKWQPKLSISWDALDTLTTYASVGVGFKSGGFNNSGSAATVNKFINDPFVIPSGFAPVIINDDFREESSTSYEAGFKSTIGSQVSWEGAIYHVDVDDMQSFEFFVGSFGLLRVVNNIDDVDIDGVETTINWTPLEWLDLYANGNWIDTEIKDFNSRPDTTGNKSPYTPDYTFNLGTTISWPLTAALTLIGNVNVTGIGDTWFHAVQDQTRPTIFRDTCNVVFGVGDCNNDFSKTERESYELVDARIGIAGENWSLVAFGRNIFDKEHLEEAIPAPEFGGTFLHPGSESRFGVEATYSF